MSPGLFRQPDRALNGWNSVTLYSWSVSVPLFKRKFWVTLLLFLSGICNSIPQHMLRCHHQNPCHWLIIWTAHHKQYNLRVIFVRTKKYVYVDLSIRCYGLCWKHTSCWMLTLSKDFYRINTNSDKHLLDRWKIATCKADQLCLLP
jgi:hypothetical protein